MQTKWEVENCNSAECNCHVLPAGPDTCQKVKIFYSRFDMRFFAQVFSFINCNSSDLFEYRALAAVWVISRVDQKTANRYICNQNMKYREPKPMSNRTKPLKYFSLFSWSRTNPDSRAMSLVSMFTERERYGINGHVDWFRGSTPSTSCICTHKTQRDHWKRQKNNFTISPLNVAFYVHLRLCVTNRSSNVR